MTVHHLEQGTPEWHAHRDTHDNASEIAAVLGLDPKATRDQLMHLKATGTKKVFSDFVQERILDHGHEVEAMARPHVEAMLAEELYPVTVSEGRISASFDGLTMDGRIGFEHKQWNAKLAELIQRGIVPDSHMPQLQQQFMACPTLEKIFIVVSDGTLDNFVYNIVLRDDAWEKRITAAWSQWHKDLAAYVPIEVPEKVVADEVVALPALSIQANGAIAIVSNLDLFGEKMRDYIASLDLEPNDDQGFANADQAVKVLQAAQDALEASEAAALSQAASIDDMRKSVAVLVELARTTRISLDKMVKTRKEQIKKDAIANTRSAFVKHCEGLAAELIALGVRFITPPVDFAEAAKNKRNLTSMHSSLRGALANARIDVDEQAKVLRDKANWFNENGGKDNIALFADLNQLIQMEQEAFQIVVRDRIAKHQQDLQAKIDAAKAAEAVQVANTTPASTAPVGSIGSKTQATVAASPEILRAAVVEHQPDIAGFLKSRDFGKEEQKVRAILVEYEKYKASAHTQARAAA